MSDQSSSGTKRPSVSTRKSKVTVNKKNVDGFVEIATRWERFEKDGFIHERGKRSEDKNPSTTIENRLDFYQEIAEQYANFPESEDEAILKKKDIANELSKAVTNVRDIMRQFDDIRHIWPNDEQHLVIAEQLQTASLWFYNLMFYERQGELKSKEKMRKTPRGASQADRIEAVALFYKRRNEHGEGKTRAYEFVAEKYEVTRQRVAGWVKDHD